MSPLQPILTLLATQGVSQFDAEAVSQLQHGLQCAALATAAAAPPPLVAACLLHDIGHLVAGPAADSSDRHEHLAMPLLRPLFPAAVTAPIQLHVAAKRYLCAVEPAYWAGLSAASQASLLAQGGPYGPAAAAAFMALPYAPDAVQLRRWDEQAKVPGLKTPALADFEPLLWAVLLDSQGGPP